MTYDTSILHSPEPINPEIKASRVKVAKNESRICRLEQKQKDMTTAHAILVKEMENIVKLIKNPWKDETINEAEDNIHLPPGGLMYD